MKLGRYEYGYFLLTITLVIAIIPVLKFFHDIPKWILLIFGTIVFIGIENVYSLWFLRYLCGNKINPWIKAHGFNYDVGGVITSEARIQGQHHNGWVLIELMHGGKNQATWIKYQVENHTKASFTLSRRGFLSQSHQTGNSPFAPYFDDEFKVKPASSEILFDASLRDRLIEIQNSNHVIDTIKLDKNELFLYYRGLIVEEEKLDGALEAISLIATSLQ